VNQPRETVGVWSGVVDFDFDGVARDMEVSRSGVESGRGRTLARADSWPSSVTRLQQSLLSGTGQFTVIGCVNRIWFRRKGCSLRRSRAGVKMTKSVLLHGPQ
jgi:hypothetical protein